MKLLILLTILIVLSNCTPQKLGSFKDTANRALRFGPHEYGYTVDSCADECENYKYFALQNNGWCCCDSDTEHVTKYGFASDCGELGGPWCNAVYVNPKYNKTPKEIGSYKDTSDRALRYGPQAYGYDAETCAEACPQFKYIALQNNGWCCCDNDFTHATKYGEASCDKQGGPWCNYIYMNRSWKHAPSKIGSYKDTSNRALRFGPHEYGYDSFKCQSACKHFKYFALQNGGWCCCANEWKDVSQYGPVEDCGDLGGPWCNTVYENRNFKPSYPGLGSWKDTEKRALRYGPQEYGFDEHSCAEACDGFQYFALQNNGWCSCDNDWNHITKYGKFGSDCYPNGGPWCNYVYHNNAPPRGCHKTCPAQQQLFVQQRKSSRRHLNKHHN